MRFIWIFLYALAMAGSNLCFRKAAAFQTGQQTWWLWFAIGNIIGFLAPVTITFALRNGQAPWIFGAAMGLGFILLQLLGIFTFGDHLNSFQTAGLLMIGIGIAFLYWKP